jgi:penicillin-binding protein 1A
VLTFVLALASLAVIAAVVSHYAKGLPDVHHLRAQWRPPQTTRIFARDGSVLAELYTERRTVIPIEQIPINLVRAVLAAEDADFYVHRGLDYPGMLRALWVNIRRGTTAQGASTITQQVVKNVFLTSERSFARKVREVVLARRIEADLSKNEILYLYLNHIAFGHGRNGVEEAARFYFGKHANQLSLGECVILAGIPKSPVHYSPRNNPEAALRRRHWILQQMVEKQFIPAAEAAIADAEPLHLRESEEDESGAPEVVDAVRAVLRATAGEEALRTGGYRVYTTIDPVLQRAARAAVQVGLRELDDHQGFHGPLLIQGARRVRGRAGYVSDAEAPPADGVLLPGHTYAGVVTNTKDPDPSTQTPGEIAVEVGGSHGVISWNSVARYVRAEQSPTVFAPIGAAVRVSVDRRITSETPGPMRLELGPQAALVSIDPQTRELRAIVGGYDAIAGGFDRATSARRQAGSAFKPILYSLGLSTRRITLASTFDPNPRCFANNWCPHESHSPSHSLTVEPPMRLREALALSRNTVAAQVVTELTPMALVEHARALGLTGDLQPVASLALGVASVTPMEMTNVYTTWAAGGRWSEPVLITRIIGPDGTDRALPVPPAARAVISPAAAYVVTQMLTSVVTQGTGARARALGRPVAGKTGTTNRSRDAWFVGYTPELVAGVWVGFDDRQPMGGVEGASGALPIWLRFMRDFVSARHPPPVDFVRPDGVVSARIDPATGLLAQPGQLNAIDEVFLSGTEPRDTTTPTADAGTATSANITATDAGTSTGQTQPTVPLVEDDDEDEDDAGAGTALPLLPQTAPSTAANTDAGTP